MKSRALLTVIAAVEASAGLALAIAPPATAHLLLGPPLEGPAALMLARVAGSALLTLGIACWAARADGGSRAGRGLVAAMLLYNAAVAALLAYAGAALAMDGVALWPCVPLHAAIAAWCGVALRGARSAGCPAGHRSSIAPPDQVDR